MPCQVIFPSVLILCGLLAACQSTPEGSPASPTQVARPVAPPTAAPPAVAKAMQQTTGSVAGTYRQATDSTDCDCDLAVTIWRTGHQLHYRIENYPEQGLATKDSTAGSQGLEFVSTPKPHQEAHEWSGTLAGDTLLVQTYGNSMNEYENFVGGCGCKFLMLVRQR